MIDLRKTNYLLIIINIILILSLVGMFIFSFKLNRSVESYDQNENIEIQKSSSYIKPRYDKYDTLSQYQSAHESFSDAVASNDLSRCATLDETFIGLCLNSIYLSLALRDGDKSLCDKITSLDLKDLCVSH